MDFGMRCIGGKADLVWCRSWAEEDIRRRRVAAAAAVVGEEASPAC